jgi:acyl-CoA thioesterase II
MGDLSVDTVVEGLGDGRYRAKLSRDWEIWGPMGGYIASIALRAAGAESSFGRPASFSCHYLGVAGFDREVDIAVVRLRSGRNAEAFRVSITQGPKAILEATVWTIAEVPGLVHDVSVAPDVPPPDELANMAELVPEGDGPPFPFWNNFEVKPIGWIPDWPPPGPREPVWRQWLRFMPAPTFADPWVDACRALIVIDVQCWPSAVQHHAWKWEPPRQEWMAPSLDLYVAFHHPCPDAGWLLADGHAPIGADGLIGWTGRMWTTDGTLVASGGGQLLCRRLSGTTPAGSPAPTAPPGSTA